MDHGGIRRPTPVRLCNSLRNSGWGGGGKGVYEARRLVEGEYTRRGGRNRREWSVSRTQG